MQIKWDIHSSHCSHIATAPKWNAWISVWCTTLWLFDFTTHLFFFPYVATTLPCTRDVLILVLKMRPWVSGTLFHPGCEIDDKFEENERKWFSQTHKNIPYDCHYWCSKSQNNDFSIDDILMCCHCRCHSTLYAYIVQICNLAIIKNGYSFNLIAAHTHTNSSNCDMKLFSLECVCRDGVPGEEGGTVRRCVQHIASHT